MKDRIKEIRTQLNLTQAEFALRIGRTAGYISNLETGVASPSKETFHRRKSSRAVLECSECCSLMNYMYGVLLSVEITFMVGNRAEGPGKLIITCGNNQIVISDGQ